MRRFILFCIFFNEKSAQLIPFRPFNKTSEITLKRKWLVTYLVFMSGLSLLAQNTHVARHISTESSGNMVGIGARYFHVEKVHVGCCAYGMNIVCTNDQDSILWEGGGYGIVPMSALRIKKTCDNGILLAYNSNKACDYMIYTNYFTKFDTLGHVVFQFSLNTVPASSPTIVDFAGAKDSTILVCTKNSIMRYSRFGSLLSTQNFSFTPINSISPLNNGHFIVNSGSNNVFYNTEIDLSLSVINQQIYSGVAYDFTERNAGDLLAKSNNGLMLRFNAGLIPLPIANYPCSDFFTKGDSTYLVGNSGGAFYTVLNASLLPVYSHTSTINNFLPTGIVVSNKKVKVIGMFMPTCYYQMPGTALFSLNLAGYFNSTQNIAIEQTSLVAYQSVYTTSNANAVFVLKARIRNLGNDTVYSFYLNNYKSVFMCELIYHQLFKVKIAPGDTATVITGAIQDGYYAGAVAGSTMVANICLYASIPNYQVDADISNNVLSNVFTLGYVGIAESANPSSNITIFPNPFTNEFKIESSEVVWHYKLTDMLGKPLMEGNADDKTLYLKTEDLTSGIYFLHVQTKLGSQTIKLVKE